ncbi:MAG: VOC family protein [Bauldia sp.]
MQRVLGIGGLFFRARDPAALSAWYRTMLGIGPSPESLEQTPWEQAAGYTVFEPFSLTNDYFGVDRAFMLNFRVASIEAMVSQLRENGVEVSAITDYPYGRFARLHDPEGNPIELWEPLTPPGA